MSATIYLWTLVIGEKIKPYWFKLLPVWFSVNWHEIFSHSLSGQGKSLSESWNVHHNGRENGWGQGEKKKATNSKTKSNFRLLSKEDPSLRGEQEVPVWEWQQQPEACSLLWTLCTAVYPERCSLTVAPEDWLAAVSSSDFAAHPHQNPSSLKVIWVSLYLSTKKAHLT